MVGFPHSEILGSKLVRSSPGLIAAYYVLHRLHAPRHPLDALKALDRSHYRCPQPRCRSCNRQLMSSGRTIAASRVDAAIVLIGQIKKPKFTCSAVSPRGAGQTSSNASLYDVEDPGRRARGRTQPKLALKRRCSTGKLVEPIGIEPTTSCLQSTRSPN